MNGVILLAMLKPGKNAMQPDILAYSGSEQISVILNKKNPDKTGFTPNNFTVLNI